MTQVRIKPRWKKLLADLWGNKARALLVVASIAVGVFAIGVIIGTYVILNTDMFLSYEMTNPANVTVLTRPFDDELVEAVRRTDGVADAEGVHEMTVRIRPSTSPPETGVPEWETLTLVAQPDPEDVRIHRRTPIAGTPVPDDRELVLEHKTLAALGLTVGDEVVVEVPDGTQRVMPVVGAVRDQADLYDTIVGGLRGYTTLESLAWLHMPKTMNKLFVTASEGGNDKAHLRQLSTAVRDRLEESGYPVYQTQISGSREHPIGTIIQALLWVLVIVGVLIAVLSSSLIANTMSALLTQHLRQIGVMKLIGARRVQIIGIYLLLITTFGAIALVVAIPPSAVGAYALSDFAAGIVNFELQPFRPIPVAIAVQVALGLLLPPIAGLAPVLKGSRTTVREALSNTGLGDNEGESGRIDKLLGRLQALSRPLLISIRNTFRRKKRLLLTLFTLTLGGAVFIGVFSSQVALDETVLAMTRYFGADITLDFTQPHRIEEVVGELTRLPGVESVEVWATTGGDLIRDDGTPPDPIGIIAPPAESELVEPRMIEGRWLLPGDETAVTVNEAIWETLPDLQTGDTLRLKVAGREDDWTVVGIFQYTGATDVVAYANYDYVSALLKQPYHASSYRIVTDQHTLAYQEEIGALITDHFTDLGYGIQEVEFGQTLATSIPRLLSILTGVLLVMALMTALVGSIGLAGTMGMNVMERTREIGVMRAIGAHNGIIFKLVIVEGLIIGLISYAIGALLSLPIGRLLSNVMSLTMFSTPAERAFAPHGFLIWLAVVIPLSVIASLLPASNAARLTIREVLAYE